MVKPPPTPLIEWASLLRPLQPREATYMGGKNVALLRHPLERPPAWTKRASGGNTRAIAAMSRNLEEAVDRMYPGMACIAGSMRFP